MNQIGQKLTSLMTSLTKNLNPKSKNFFHLSLLRVRTALYSTISRGAMLLLRHVERLDVRLISKYEYIVPWQWMCQIAHNMLVF